MLNPPQRKAVVKVKIPQCLRCETEMKEGFIVDHTYGAHVVARWVAGAPESSFWTGTKTKGKVMRQIRTFRCPQCGYLESYADQALI